MPRNICCVCMKAPTALRCLSETDDDLESWSSKLSYCVPEVVWLDHYVICQKCCTQVEEVRSFKLQCLKADDLRQSLTEALKTSCAKNAQTATDNVECVKAESTVDINSQEVSVKEEKLDSDEGVVVKIENVKIEEEHDSSIESNFYEETDELIHKTESSLDYFESEFIEEPSENQTICSKCYENCATEEELLEHLHTFHERYKCDFCKKTFLGSNTFANHMSNDHKNVTGINLFRCSICKERYETATELYKHRNTHSHKCKFCDQSFRTKSGLQTHLNHRHLKPVTEKKSFVVICKICKTHFKTKDSLNYHMRSKHTDSSSWRHMCTVCNKKFPSARPLVLHMRRHLGVKPYKCKLCEKSYVSTNDLNKHMIAHKNGHPGRCYYCDQEYKERIAMEQHLANIHQVEIKAYVCNICNKGFNDNQQLSRHVRTHGEERPFKCDKCEKAYCEKSNLKAHMLRNHKK